MLVFNERVLQKLREIGSEVSIDIRKAAMSDVCERKTGEFKLT